MNLSHAQLVVAARRWLRNVQRCPVVITEMSSNAGERPDAIGFTRHGESILVECKASRADFIADRAKSFRVMPDAGMGACRYFLSAPGVITASDLPHGWGLLEVTARGVSVVVRSHAGECYSSHHNVASCNAAFSERAHRGEVLMLMSLIRRLAGPGVRGRTTADIEPYTNDEFGNAVTVDRPVPDLQEPERGNP